MAQKGAPGKRRLVRVTGNVTVSKGGGEGEGEGRGSTRFECSERWETEVVWE